LRCSEATRRRKLMKRLLAFGLSLGLVAALAVPAVAAPADGVRGGGSFLVPAGANAGDYGAVSVTATVGDVDSGVVNLSMFDADGGRDQHFVGDVTDVVIDGNEACIVGEVRVLQLGSNTNEGMYFEMVVEDNGQPSEGMDMLNWIRSASARDCATFLTPGQELVSGNLTVRG
jgi:hypothetical protein